MIRKVAFGKAVLAGAAGAAAWEVAARVASLAGIPVFDLVKTLGTMAAGSRPLLWWPLGMGMHALVGAIWAVFYAYFFWSLLERPPLVQGLVFALVPAFLAGFVMVPEIGFMRPQAPPPGLFATALGWAGPATIVLGHLVWGAVTGAVYTHPVGSRNRR